MPQKGSSFEREFCKKLSLWWTKGQDDDIFWRSSQSGGRATQRAKSGKRTANSYGDVAAVEDSGFALVNLITFELKRGYKDSGVDRCLDRPDRMKEQEFDSFINQTINSALNAGTPYWMLVTRRDQRIEMVWIPLALYNEINHVAEDVLAEVHNSGLINLWNRYEKEHRLVPLYFCGSEDFFELVDPEDIQEIINGQTKRMEKMRSL